MFNALKLRGKMVEKQITVEMMASRLGINPVTLYRKTTGKSEFTRSEIQVITDILALSMQEVKDIFFADELTET